MHYTLTVEDVAGPGDAPAGRRLARLLKLLLRSFGFKRMSVTQAPTIAQRATSRPEAAAGPAGHGDAPQGTVDAL
jgi:hypothetical protein